MPFTITSAHQLGPTLKGLRKARARTQMALAQQSGLGQKTVSLLETDPGRCSVDTLMRYLAALEVPLVLDLPETAEPDTDPVPPPADEAW